MSNPLSVRGLRMRVRPLFYPSLLQICLRLHALLQIWPR